MSGRSTAIWRGVVNYAKDRPWAMRLADPLSRGRGRLRVLDRLARIPKPEAPDLSRWQASSLAACWIGHASVLFRIGGWNILTDPVWSNRVGLGVGLATVGPTRLVAPALPIASLPSIDLVLISHAHFDHLDIPTLTKLERSSTIVCANDLRDLLEPLKFRQTRELSVGDSASFQGHRPTLTITAIPVRHWGARMLTDRNRGYCAFLIETPTQRILFGGDSAFQDHWKNINGVDIAAVGIGAYEPWIDGHANPEQAWTMGIEHARARLFLPTHHSTFVLSREPVDEPMQRLLQVAGDRSDRVICRKPGDCHFE